MYELVCIFKGTWGNDRTLYEFVCNFKGAWGNDGTLYELVFIFNIDVEFAGMQYISIPLGANTPP